jgi:polysaccharide export outer membrane protein
MDHPDPLCVAPPSQSQGLTSGACNYCIRGIDCSNSNGTEQRWRDVRTTEFEPLRHGEYVGPVRLPAMLEYRARVGDEFQFIFVLTREKDSEEYRLMVGDEVLIESVSDESIKRGDFTRGVQIQSDGTVVLRLIGPVQAAGKTVPELRKDIERAYADYLKNPSIDVTPIKTNTRLEDLRSAVSNFIGVNGGQNISALVTPDGHVQLPLIGSVNIVGMTMAEIKREINLRYRDRVTGVELEPRLVRQAASFVYVFGEVNRPGRFEISAPTTVTQALAMAEGLQLGGNNRQIVIFRRAEDWRLVSTMLDLRGAHLGKRPNPADEIWLRDNDLIIVPPRPIKVFNDFVRQVFTDGLYPMVPGFLNVSSTGDVSIQGGR